MRPSTLENTSRSGELEDKKAPQNIHYAVILLIVLAFVASTQVSA